jgi:hypothetical protein
LPTGATAGDSHPSGCFAREIDVGIGDHVNRDEHRAAPHGFGIPTLADQDAIYIDERAAD